MRGLWQRAGWNLVDQVLSSGTNALLSFVVARQLTDSAFGGFAVAFTVFSLLIGASRAITTAPLAMRFADADADPPRFARASSAVAGTALAVGAVSGVLAVAVGLAVGGGVGRALVALGVVLPGLLVQDAWRHVFFAAGRPAAAALNDAVWAVVQLVAVVALLVVGVSTAGPLVLAWGLAAVAAAVLGAVQARTRPAMRRAGAWLREQRDVTRYLLAEFAVLQCALQGALLLIAVVGSLEAIGALRAVQVLLGPATVISVAAFAFAVPEFARRARTMSPRGWTVAAAAISTAVGVLAFAWGLLWLLAPDALGHFLLGATWPGTESVLLPTVLGQVAGALGLGPEAMLNSLQRPRVTFGVHLVEAPLIVLGGVGGELVGGAIGAAWGLAAVFWVMTPLLWFRFRRELRLRPTVPTGDSTVVSP